MAVVEALASGTPVIISDRVNIWREIEASGGGWICADTRESLGGVLRALDLRDDAGATRRDARGALDCHARYFRIETAARRLVRTVEAAVNRVPA